MDYKKIHDTIINRAKIRSLNGYCEKHHIIPKCMGGTDDKVNLVKLTAKEHWLIHLLLIEIYPENSKLKIAIFRMMYKSANQTKKLIVSSGRQFERLRKMVSEAHSKLLKGRKMKPFTDEHKTNISKGKKGKPSHRKGISLSYKTKEKIGKASIGRIDGDKNPMKKPEQIKRMVDFNPMKNKKTLKKFKGDKNPNSKKVLLVSTNKTFKTVNDCVLKLKIDRNKFYRMVKKKEIIYL